MSNEQRIEELKLWMEERKISTYALAELMGVSQAFVYLMLKRENIPEKRHRQLIAIGFPERLIPPAFLGPKGRPPKRGEYVPPLVEA